jgi:uncharacterized protein (DUF779 family)
MASCEAAQHGGRQQAARGGRRPAEQHVIATEAARQAVNRLRAARGPLMFVQSAGCCGGSAPMCFPAGEYVTGPGDLLLGSIEDCPFYMDARQYEAWHPGQLVLDVEAGLPEGFSLPAGEGLHFVTRTSAQCRQTGELWIPDSSRRGGRRLPPVDNARSAPFMVVLTNDSAVAQNNRVKPR